MVSISNPDIRLLRVFLTVVECGGFSAAQAALNLNQSTISNHMLALEQRLGCRLCERGRSGFRLTEAGERVVHAARRLLTAVNDFRADTERLHGRLGGSLRIGVVDNTTTDPAAPLHRAFARFNARPHSVQVDMVIEGPQELQRRVVDRRLDLAIIGFAPRLPELHYRLLHREMHGFYCGATHSLFDWPDETITLAEIRKHRIVERRYWRQHDIKRLGIARADATVDQMEAQLILIRSGAYLGFLPVHYAAPWASAGELRQIAASRLGYASSFRLVTRKGASLSAAAETFVEDVLAVILPQGDGSGPGTGDRRAGAANSR